MAFTVAPAPLYGQGGSYSARQDRLHFGSLARMSGVANQANGKTGTLNGDLAVTTTGTGNGSVNVAAGSMWLQGTSGYGAYFAYNDSSSVVGPFAANATGNSRYDLIVVRVSDTGVGAPTVAFAVVQGTAAASPTIPALTITSTTIEAGVAAVLIPNGWTTTSTVSASNIYDQRGKPFLSNRAVPDNTTTFVPSPVNGDLMYNMTSTRWEEYSSGAWKALQAGPYICTSSTRPGASMRYTGMRIYQTDNNRSYFYDGSNWVCEFAMGTYVPTQAGFNTGTTGASNLVQYAFGNGVLTLQGKHVFGSAGTTFPASSDCTVTLPTDFTLDTSMLPSGIAVGVMSVAPAATTVYGGLILYTFTSPNNLLRFLVHRYNGAAAGVDYTALANLGTGVPLAWAATGWIYWTATLYGTFA